MLEFVVIITCISLIIIGLIVAIPTLVKLNTDAENDPNHLFSIFMRESGFRGERVTSVGIVTLPLILMARPPSELMVFVGFLVFAIISLFFHLPVYQGYNVLNKKMRHILFGLLGALLVICLLAKCEIIGSTLYIVLHCFISIYWGGLAVYKRAKIIKHTQALKQTP